MNLHRRPVGPYRCVYSLTLLAVVATVVEAADPMDWPMWRGPQQNNSSTETGLVDSWNPDGGEGSNLLWKSEELGGRSTPIVTNGKLYTLVRDQPGSEVEGEKVVCVDAATGKKLWEHRFNVYLCEVPDTRVAWSSVVGDPETGRVYAQSVSGYFCCLEGDTGELVWDHSLQEEIGLINTYGGRTNFPLVFEDQVITSAVIVGWGDDPKYGRLAVPAHRFLGMDKATGEIRWLSGTGLAPYDTTYSTPTIKPINGQQTMVFASGDGEVWGMQPRTGKLLWHFPFSRMGISTSPLVDNKGRVYASHSEENTFGNTMGSVVCLDGSMTGDLTGKEIWRQFEVMAGKSSPLLVDDRLYIVDDRAKLFVFDANTGKELAYERLGAASRSTPLYADGKIYYADNSGRWYILKPTDEGVEIIHKLRLDDVDVDGSPIVSHGRIYLPTSGALYCIGDANVKPIANPLPEQPQEKPISEDQKPALVQVVPYDVILAPGKSQAYKVRLFNSLGQLLKEVPASEVRFGVDGPGKTNAEGQYTAPTENEHQVALVTCQVGDLTGTARVRVVPPLPWEFDFAEGDVPLTWVGGRIRYVIREKDGERFIAKKNLLPTPKNPNNKLGTRSQMTMGPIDLSNYTIQADFTLDELDGRLPDFGVINSTYTLAVRPMSHQLRIYSWSPHDHRTFAAAEFDPEPYKWYTMKLRVEPGEGQATVRGKIWPRGEAEPSGWTVEMVDKSPNLQGSPGLFGKTETAELSVDNIKVYSNK
jgi:outer membrane protein assembly factor BamB